MSLHNVIVAACDAEGCAANYQGPNRDEARAQAADGATRTSRDCSVHPETGTTDGEEEMSDLYPPETLSEDDDCGVMPANVAALADAVVGRRIVSAETRQARGGMGYWRDDATVLTLDDGTVVELVDTADCCAFTAMESFLLHPERVDHMILGVGTTDGFTTWHIFADFGDVMELRVGWSCGNPFYYGYGFDITVRPPHPSEGSVS